MKNTQQKIKCPKCGESISIDDVLTHQIEEKIKKELGEENILKEAEIVKQKKELEDILKAEFPYDEILPVPKGVSGVVSSISKN